MKNLIRIEELSKQIPEDMILPKLPISLNELKKMAEKEKRDQKA